MNGTSGHIFTYRDYIDREYSRRSLKNPAYSLRAFARDMQISPSRLSEVLRNKSGLSESVAAKLTRILNLSEVEAKHFITLVKAEHSRNGKARQKAREMLRTFRDEYGYSEVDVERFKIISEWYHLALLELMQLKGFNGNAEALGKSLKVPAPTIAKALERLVHFGFATYENGEYKPTGSNRVVNAPVREAREFHLQLIHRALSSVENDSVEERDVSSTILPIRREDFPKVQALLKQLHRDFALSAQSKTEPDSLYGLTIQLFPIAKGEES